MDVAFFNMLIRYQHSMFISKQVYIVNLYVRPEKQHYLAQKRAQPRRNCNVVHTVVFIGPNTLLHHILKVYLHGFRATYVFQVQKVPIIAISLY